MFNAYIANQPIEIRRKSYICRMFSSIGMTYDIIVDGVEVYTSFDAGDAKQFCIDNKLSRKISNFRIEKYQ